MKRFEVGARVVDPTYGFGSVVAVEDANSGRSFPLSELLRRESPGASPFAGEGFLCEQYVPE